MLKVKRTYRTSDGQKFQIIAKKTVPASNGANFIGENLKSGVIAHFNHKGEHAWDKNLNLECDPYKWVGIVNGDISAKGFVKKEELKSSFPLYLRIENNDPFSITCVDRSGFELTYA